MKAARRIRWLALPLVVYLALLADWRGSSALSSPVVRRAFDVRAPLSAGAARVPLSPPLPVVRAGYGPPRAVAEWERDPLEVRAVVLRCGDKSLALVLADVVLVPEELVRSLEARLTDLRLDGLLLAATHTHSSVGGFDRRLLAQAVGMGRFREEVEDLLLDRAEAAVRQATQRTVPVRVRTAETRLAGWAENRSTPGGRVDDALTVAALVGDEGARVATLAVVAAHPTLLPRTVPQLSGDYPGEAMRRLAAGSGPALLFQGAAGDARPPGSGFVAIDSGGALVARHVSEAVSGATGAEDRLGFVEVEVGLPPAEPQAVRQFLLRRPASNVLQWLAPATARLTAVTIGDLTLLTVPGEITEAASARMMAALPERATARHKVRVLSLAQGYVGYIDTPERVRAGHGEARRAWFAPELLERVTEGLAIAVGHP